MSDFKTERIRGLANNQTVFDLKLALALKVSVVSRTDLDRIDILEKALEETMKRVQEAEIAGDLNSAAELKYGCGSDYSQELEKLKFEITDKVDNLFSNFPYK